MGEGPLLDQEFIRFLLQLGTGGAIAGLLFFFYRKDVRMYADLWKAQAEREDRRTEALIILVEKNTTATVTNTEVLRALHKRIDRLELLKVVGDPTAGYEGDEERAADQKALPPGRRT